MNETSTIYEKIDQLLLEFNIEPVLIDIGASYKPPVIWNPIAKHSIYVGFDPDQRDLQEIPDSMFKKAFLVNKAVTKNLDDGWTNFYFTQSPHCSSTLPPDSKSLENYSYSDLFAVTHTERVSSTTLNLVIDDLSLKRVDWIKTDSQGIDLQVVKGLRPELYSHLLTLDIEPGLIDAYVGEDLFPICHTFFTGNGYWLSDIRLGNAIRIRKATMERVRKLTDLTFEEIEKKIRKHPAWVNARYIRTLQWVNSNNFSERDLVLLWIFTMLDNQMGFALDLAIEYEKKFGTSKLAKILIEEPIKELSSKAH